MQGGTNLVGWGPNYSGLEKIPVDLGEGTNWVGRGLNSALRLEKIPVDVGEGDQVSRERTKFLVGIKEKSRRCRVGDQLDTGGDQVLRAITHKNLQFTTTSTLQQYI